MTEAHVSEQLAEGCYLKAERSGSNPGSSSRKSYGEAQYSGGDIRDTQDAVGGLRYSTRKVAVGGRS